MKILGNNCSWILDGKMFSSDLELDAYLKKFFEDNPSATIDDLFTASMKNAQELAKQRLEAARVNVTAGAKAYYKKNGKISEYVSGVDPEDAEIFYQIPRSIGTTRFLQLSLPGLNPLVPAFDQNAWYQHELDRLMKGEFVDSDGVVHKLKDKNGNEIATISDKEDAEKIINAMMDTWPELSEQGTEIHKVFEDIFNGKTPQKPDSGYLSDSVLFTRLVDQINNFKQSLLERYGANCQFYPEYVIKSSKLDDKFAEVLKSTGNDSINGKIDLLILDEQGNVHIYDFKVSRKSVGDWDEQNNGIISDKYWWHTTKKMAASYQLAIYAMILQQQGFNVQDVNILPIKTTLEYSEEDIIPGYKFSDFKAKPTKLIDIDVQFGYDAVKQKDRSIQNVKNVLSGKYRDEIRDIFGGNFKADGPAVVAINDTYKTFFPCVSSLLESRNAKLTVEHYKNDPQYVTKLTSSDSHYPGWKFVKRGTKYEVKYFKETEEALLDAEIEEYISKLRSKAVDDCENVSVQLEQVFAKSIPFETFVESFRDIDQSFVRTQFARYIEGGWNFNRDSALNQLGIFVFEKNNEVELVVLSNEDLRRPTSMGLGTTVLGKTKRNRDVDTSQILEANHGNLSLIKGLIYVSQNQDQFEGKRIVEVRAVNPWYGQETTVENSRLHRNFEELRRNNPDANVPRLHSNIFIPDAVAFVKSAVSRINALLPDVAGDFDANEAAYTEQWIDKSISRLKTKYPELYRQHDEHFYGQGNEAAWHALQYLEKAKLACHGIFMTTEIDKGDYLTNGTSINGLRVSSMQYSPSANIRALGKVIDKHAAEVKRRIIADGNPVRDAFEEFYKNHSHSTSEFDIWFEDKEKLILKDPSHRDFAGDASARKALDLFLKTMDKLRFPNAQNNIDIESRKLTKVYYEFPLTAARGSQQMKYQGLWKTITNKVDELKQTTEGVFANDQISIESLTSKNRKEIYNKFNLSGNARLDKIEQYGGAGYFEHNVELVFNEALVSFERSAVSRETIPVIAAMRLALVHADQYGGDDNNTHRMENILKAFDDNVTSKLYGQSIIKSPSLRALQKFLNVFKGMFTTMCLSLNVKSFFRESLQGIYNGVAHAGVKMLPGVNEKHYINALTHVVQEARKNFSSTSKLQQLNAVYALANQSLSQIANSRKLDWANPHRWGKDTLFLTATAPDFMHRVSILVAKMMADGCWDAHSLDENGNLVYNWKNDKRFEHFVKNQNTHPDYLKEKSLYLKMIEEFNKDGFRNKDGLLLKEGDDLPQAYTVEAAQGIKNYADLLYGHYDDESRSLLNDSFIGSFFMQYKTWVTSKLEQWTMTEGTYDTKQLVEQKDENGDSLYELIKEREDGSVSRDILTKAEYEQLSEEDKAMASVYYDYDGIPMEGMLQNAWHFTKALFTWNQEDLNKLWEDPHSRALLKLAIHDQFWMMLMMLLVSTVFGVATGVEKPLNEVEVYKQIKTMGPTTQLAYNVLTGSLQDSQLQNILGSFKDEPPMIQSLTKFSTSTWSVVTGNSNIAYWATRNFGAVSQFQGVAKKLDEARKEL